MNAFLSSLCKLVSKIALFDGFDRNDARTVDRGEFIRVVRPTHCVFQNFLHERVIKSGESFVPGLKIKHFSRAALERDAAAEHPSALIPAGEDRPRGFGDPERLAVHFFFRKIDIGRQSLGDGMSRRADPKALALAVLAPAKLAARADDALERFA